jgi:transcription elongation factor GreA
METFLTKKRLDEFKEELELLKTKRRLEVSEKLRDAKELGDLSENSEYLEAREEHARVETRIMEVEDIIKDAIIIKENGGTRDEVDIGSTIDVVKDGKKLRFVIVGTSEARPEDGFISNQSPLGRELMGRKVGDTIVIDTPSGNVKYRIRKIS